MKVQADKNGGFYTLLKEIFLKNKKLKMSQTQITQTLSNDLEHEG